MKQELHSALEDLESEKNKAKQINEEVNTIALI